jgi:hypothetical protein
MEKHLQNSEETAFLPSILNLAKLKKTFKSKIKKYTKHKNKFNFHHLFQITTRGYYSTKLKSRKKYEIQKVVDST